MGSPENNEDFDFPIVEEAKISMALAEAEFTQSDIFFLSTKPMGVRPGIISHALSSWVQLTKGTHTGALTVLSKGHPAHLSLRQHRKVTAHSIDPSLHTREFNEILLIGKEVAICDINGELVIHRNDQALAAAIRRVMTKLIGITKTLEQQKR